MSSIIFPFSLERWIASMEEAMLADADKPGLLSLLFLEIGPQGATITPVFLKDLNELYDVSDGPITIRNTNPKPDPARIEKCKQKSLAITI